MCKEIYQRSTRNDVWVQKCTYECMQIKSRLFENCATYTLLINRDAYDIDEAKS